MKNDYWGIFSRTHKNVSVKITNTTYEEIEKILDELAVDVKWEGKTVTQNENSIVILFSTQTFVNSFFVGKQNITFTLNYTNENVIQMDIDSRFKNPNNMFEFILSLIRFPNIFYIYYDFYHKNETNISYICNSLKDYYKNSITIPGFLQTTEV